VRVNICTIEFIVPSIILIVYVGKRSINSLDQTNNNAQSALMHIKSGNVIIATDPSGNGPRSNGIDNLAARRSERLSSNKRN